MKNPCAANKPPRRKTHKVKRKKELYTLSDYISKTLTEIFIKVYSFLSDNRSIIILEV